MVEVCFVSDGFDMATVYFAVLPSESGTGRLRWGFGEDESVVCRCAAAGGGMRCPMMRVR